MQVYWEILKLFTFCSIRSTDMSDFEQTFVHIKIVPFHVSPALCVICHAMFTSAAVFHENYNLQVSVVLQDPTLWPPHSFECQCLIRQISMYLFNGEMSIFTDNNLPTFQTKMYQLYRQKCTECVYKTIPTVSKKFTDCIDENVQIVSTKMYRLYRQKCTNCVYKTVSILSKIFTYFIDENVSIVSTKLYRTT